MKYILEVWDDSIKGQEKIIKTYEFDDLEIAKAESRRLADEDLKEEFAFFLTDENEDSIEF